MSEANWITRLARWVGLGARPAPVVQAPARGGARMYASARPSRLTAGFGTGGNSSADSELSSSLSQLRARSRQMVRDSAYARRAKVIVVNNVVGAGIGLQAQVMTTRDSLRAAVNDEIETRWAEWCKASTCHTGGALHFGDLERAAMGQVFEAGEVFIRAHYSRFGDSEIPLALELIEAERIGDEFVGPTPRGEDVRTRMGIELDRFGRAVAYWVRRGHPGDLRDLPETDRYERVPASDMFHLRIVDRWPQTRGEPWLCTVLVKLDAMNEYSAAEVQAAKLSALHFGTIENTPDPAGAPPLATEGAGTGAGDAAAKPTYEVEAGMLLGLEPGDKVNWHAPSRPNTAIDPFLRYMLREVAAGVGPSYESLSRDYSQSNYSSSRLALLDDRDLWRTLQQWWIRSFRRPLHALWLRQAVNANAFRSFGIEEYYLDPRKFEAVLFKPRGWSWVDPTKEVNAYKEAIKAGFTTVTDVIAQTAGGMDIEDVISTRRRELDMFEAEDIPVDTTPAEAQAGGQASAAPPPKIGDEDDDTPQEPPARLFSFPR